MSKRTKSKAKLLYINLIFQLYTFLLSSIHTLLQVKNSMINSFLFCFLYSTALALQGESAFLDHLLAASAFI